MVFFPLFFLLIFSYFFQVIFSDSNLNTYKCIDKSLKDGKCMTKGVDVYGHTEHLVDKSCGKNEICATINDEYGSCIKHPKHRVPGKSCRYNYECDSGVCNSENKCEGLAEELDCTSYSQCASGLACSAYTTRYSTILNECKRLVDSGTCTTFNNMNDTLLSNCAFQMVCTLTDPSSTTTNCVPIGSLADGYYSSNRYACKSGFTQDNYCVSISESGDCINNALGESVCSITLSAPNQETSKNKLDGKSVTVDCVFAANGNYVCPESGQSEIYQKYVDLLTEKYNNLVEDGNTDIYTNVVYRETLNNKEVSYLLFQYRYYYIINRLEEDDCSVKYLWLLNDGSFIKVNLVYILLAWCFFVI